VAVAWNCGSKCIYGQTRSVCDSTCAGLRAYTITVTLAAASVRFHDDVCGDLVLADDIGASGALYVFLGADNDYGTAHWDDVSIWGDPIWLRTDEPTISPAPSKSCADYALELSDSWGDGWNGNTLSITSCDDGSVLVDGVTMEDGEFESFVFCEPLGIGGVSVHVGGGLWGSELSWTLTLPSGETVTGAGLGTETSGGSCDKTRAPSTTPAPSAVCETYMVNLYDVWGDGWNGNTLSISPCDDDAAAPYVSGLTIEDGFAESLSACLPTGITGFTVAVGGGTWASECFFELFLPDGSTMALTESGKGSWG